MYELGDLSAVSGSWLPIEVELIRTARGQVDGLRHVKWDVLEGSFVPIGAGPNAHQRMLATRAIDPRDRDFFTRSVATPGCYVVRDLPAAPLPPAERLAAAVDRLFVTRSSARHRPVDPRLAARLAAAVDRLTAAASAPVNQSSVIRRLEVRREAVERLTAADVTERARRLRARATVSPREREMLLSQARRLEALARRCDPSLTVAHLLAAVARLTEPVKI
jgi:hypothetical protein